MSHKLLQKNGLIKLCSAVWSHLETLSELFSVSAELLCDVWGLPILSLVVLRVVAPACVIKEDEFASIPVAVAAR